MTGEINPTIHTDRSVKYQSSVISNVGIIGTTDKHILVSDVIAAAEVYTTFALMACS